MKFILVKKNIPTKLVRTFIEKTSLDDKALNQIIRICHEKRN